MIFMPPAQRNDRQSELGGALSDLAHDAFAEAFFEVILAWSVFPRPWPQRPSTMSFNPEDQYVYLAANGQGVVTPGGEAFWSLPPEVMAQFEQGWVISEFVCAQDWDNLEMHPNAEEFVYLLSGDIELLQELPNGIVATRISGRGAALVPRSVWHTARVFAPSRMLFVTMGGGTQHKPFGKA